MYNNPKQTKFIPSDVKILLTNMAMEKGLYSKVVIISRKYLDNKKGK